MVYYCNKLGFDFTSHIVHIKPDINGVLRAGGANLYIPHSSYKTEDGRVEEQAAYTFTSHIVHIKLVLPTPISAHQIPLHPT